MTDFKNIEERISAYLDGEMTADQRITFEDDLERDSALATRLSKWEATDLMLGGSIPAPDTDHLDDLFKAAQSHQSPWPIRRVAAMAAGFLLGGAGGYGLHFAQAPQSQPEVIIVTASATAAHRMFSAEVRHAVEVSADETDHLQTWLTKRMGREMKVPVLDAYGLKFIGGRMLPFEDRAAAQYMYETSDGERLTLFMTRSENEAKTSLRYLEEDDLTTARWQDGPWVFILTSPLERDALTPIAAEVQDTLI